MESRIRTQIERWRDGYINTSIRRNTLLHLDKKTSKGVLFSCNDSFSYEHFWTMAIGAGEHEEYALRSKANADPRYHPIAWRAEKEQEGEDPCEVKILDEIIKTGYKSIAEKGENPVCMALGKLTWRVSAEDNSADKKEDGFTYIQTPLLLIPVKLNKRGVNYWLKPTYEEGIINPALLLKYASQGYMRFPLPACGQWIDKENFDIKEYFEDLENHFSGGEFTFEKDYVALNIFEYDKICMYRDVSRHLDEICQNPVIRGLFGAPLRERCTPVGLDYQLPEKSFCVLDTNSGQSEVIERFIGGESFILEGPPGTGKTQTIVNMISEAVMRDKSVLFVSGKMSALETVAKKLNMPEARLDKRCLLVQGEKETGEISLSDIYAKLQASYDAPRPVIEVDEYRDNIKTLKETRDILVGYNREFYDEKNSLGVSAYDLIGRMLLLGYNENYISTVDYDEKFIESLTTEKLEKRVRKMSEVETLLSTVVRLYGGVEKDIWYGYGKEEVDPKTENELRAFCVEFSTLLKRIKELLQAQETDERGEGKEENALKTLLKSPLLSVVATLDLKGDESLPTLYLKENLETEKKAVVAEEKRAEEYADAVARVKDLAWEEEILPLPEQAEEYAKWKLSQVAEEEKKVHSVANALSMRFDESAYASNAQLRQILEIAEAYLTAQTAKEELQKEISLSYSDEIFAFKHKKLLAKFRVSWEKNLKEDKTPFLYGYHIKPVKKCCKDAVNTSFSMSEVYALLEKLESYHQTDGQVEALRKELDENGLAQVRTADGIKTFANFLTTYLDERENFAIDTLLYGEKTFRAYLTGKAELLESVLNTARALGVKANITVEEISSVLNACALLRKHNDRIGKNSAWKNLFPSIEKNCFTDWKKILSALELLEKIKESLRGKKESLQENCQAFIRLVEKLSGGELHLRCAELVEKYRGFYGDRTRFDHSVMGNAHDCKEMSLADFETWHSQISDFNRVSVYTSYRKRVRELDGYGKAFFDWYKKAGRKEYPLSKMRDHYEISLLYAYYISLLKKSKYLSLLGGRDGITSVASVSETYAKADEKSLRLNRKLLEDKFYTRISRSASAKGNLHSYLRSIPKGQNASVRRLFQTRSESIKQLSPCIMMSVYSVSKLLEYGKYDFDVVIFDEASQIPAGDALTALMRAKKQVVIAGDPKQMPAISYFKAKEEKLDEEETEVCDSVIDFVIRSKNSALSYERLDMHYRSNHESLIKYSNEHPALYGGNLVTFPSPKARKEDFGLWNYSLADDESLEKGELVGGGGENLAEAKLTVELIRKHFEKYPLPKESEVENYSSLGVIVFGTNQKKLLTSLLEKDKTLKKLLSLNDNRVFFIATADEIQGDETSEMILSLTYGRDSEGKLTQAWGHLNQHPVALYKFNVAVTRARDNLKFIHSVRANEIVSPNLQYIAEYIRQFDNFQKEPFVSHKEYNTKFVEGIGKICESVVGADRVVYNYGESPRSYRVPISVLTKDGEGVALGILCEENRGGRGEQERGAKGASSGQGFSVREYARTCKDVLTAHGWTNLYETYAMQWIRNYAFEKRKLIEKLNQIL